MTHEFFSFFHFSYNEWKRQQSIQKSQQQQQPRHNQSHGNNYKPPAGGRSERLFFFTLFYFPKKEFCTFNGFGVLCLKGSTPTRQLFSCSCWKLVISITIALTMDILVILQSLMIKINCFEKKPDEYIFATKYFVFNKKDWMLFI